MALFFPGPEKLGAQAPVSGKWITAWGTAQNALGMTPISNATVRMIARVSIPGEAARFRLHNRYGTKPLNVGKAYVGLRVRGAILSPGSNKQVFFNRSATVTIPPGGSVESDPVPMKLIVRDELAVSLFIPEADVRPSQHGGALVTSYMSEKDSGDLTADEIATNQTPGGAVPLHDPFTVKTTSMLWLDAVDVLSPSAMGSVVVVGDSITDGSCATVDAYDRWPDVLANRLALAGMPMAIVNKGIGGNSITREGIHPPPGSDVVLERLERDVFTHHGVTHVILFEGTNDTRGGAPLAQIQAGMREVIKQVKAHGLKIIGATAIPRHSAAPNPALDQLGWNDGMTKIRHDLNTWMRTQAGLDAVLDFDKVMLDPANPEVNYPTLHCDGIHPNPRGYFAMGASVPLDLFKHP
jgi:lysophospholipase L1-like esterase